MNIFLGASASQGIGKGQAFVIPEPIQKVIPHFSIDSSNLESEWTRFTNAKEKISSKIQTQLASLDLSSKSDKLQRDLLETYILMLEDPVFNAEIKQKLESSYDNIEFILDTKTQEYAERLRNSGNDYLAERAQDIEDIFGKVLNILLNIVPFEIEKIPDNCVLVAKTLSPSDAMIFSKRKILGLAMGEGGTSSHVAILARNFEIPAVFGLEKFTREIFTDDFLIIDGNAGEVLVNPDEQAQSDYELKIKAELEHKAKIGHFKNLPAITKDGVKFKLYANIGTPEEAKMAIEEGADGIGLFRTEFLFMSNSDTKLRTKSMSEEEQFEAYKTVLETMNGKPVTIRTLDSGGDKILSLTDIPVMEEKNPLMGLRAIRVSLRYPQLLKTQLRALYRASVYGNLKIMLPLLTEVNQVVKAKEIAKSVQEELEAENIPFDKNVPIGIMVETPAAGITADCFAKVSDFFSIGSNDLTQYTLNVDRENGNVVALYDELHLAVTRLIHYTVQAAKRENIPISVCGEMASKDVTAKLLAGMGIRDLSMGAKRIPYIKEMLSNYTISELEEISKKALNTFTK